MCWPPPLPRRGSQVRISVAIDRSLFVVIQGATVGVRCSLFGTEMPIIVKTFFLCRRDMFTHRTCKCLPR